DCAVVLPGLARATAVGVKGKSARVKLAPALGNAAPWAEVSWVIEVLKVAVEALDCQTLVAPLWEITCRGPSVKDTGVEAPSSVIWKVPVDASRLTFSRARKLSPLEGA